jgi:integral membrane protein
MNPIHRLRQFTLMEGTSFLVLLFVAMPLKYLAHMPMAVRILGMLHGILFVSVVVQLLVAARAAKWSAGRAALVFVSALIPFGPFLIDRRLRAYEAAMSSQS